MFYKANSRQVVIDGNTMNYIEFGTGKKALVILPGLGDGLSPVHGKMQAIILALTYKQFDREFRVYIFSRKNRLERDCSTRSMAKEQATSCVHHNAYSELDKIVCPTLVIGGECDKIVGTASSIELAEKSRIVNYSFTKTMGMPLMKKQETLMTVFFSSF